MFPPSVGLAFGSVGRLKRGMAYLLIPQGLLARLLGRAEERVLYLKDLLAMFPPNCRTAFSALSDD